MFTHRVSIHDVRHVRLEAPSLLCTGTWSRRIALESKDGDQTFILLFYEEGQPPRLSSDYDELPAPPDPTEPFVQHVGVCSACGNKDVDLLWGYCETCLEDNYQNL